VKSGTISQPTRWRFETEAWSREETHRWIGCDHIAELLFGELNDAEDKHCYVDWPMVSMVVVDLWRLVVFFTLGTNQRAKK
jgi:hypothetical protein